MYDKEAVAERLRRFGKTRFDTMSNFARVLKMTPQALGSTYLNARSLPGGELLVKLAMLNCDLNWLLTGIGKPPDTDVRREVESWIDYCRGEVVYWERTLTLEDEATRAIAENDLRFALNTPVDKRNEYMWDIIKAMKPDVYEKEYPKLKMAAEPKHQYKTKRGKKK